MSNIKNPDTCTYKTLFEKHQVDQYNIDFLNLYQKIRKELLKLSISKCRPKVIRNQIHTYQHYSINILEQLELNAHQCEYKKNCLKYIVLPKINFHIEFLKFLKEQFPHYFDNEALVPTVLFKKYSLQCSIKLKQIIKRLDSSPSADLIQIMIDDLSLRKYTFSEYDSLKEAVNTISQHFKELEDQEESFLSLIKILITNNFYTEFVYNFIIDDFSRTINLIDTPCSVINQLKYLSKEINQTTQKSPTQTRLKQALINWIKQELNYYKYSFHVADSAQTPERLVQSPLETIKVKTNITVGQMACFVHQLIETNIIETDNKKETIKMFSTVFTSKNSDSISEKSLINKFFNIDDKAAETTKQLFLDLFKSIRN